MKTMHIAYGHRTDDTRILKKECESLAKHGYDVIYVTSNKLSKETFDLPNVKRLIIPLQSNNRVFRIIRYMHDIRKLIKREKPDVCHIHDFQILPLLITIPRNTMKIFDSHEDYPAYIADTSLRRLNFTLKYRAIETIERICFKKCIHIISATPYIKKQIEKFGLNVTDVNNYPLVSLNKVEKKYNHLQICFTGGAGDSSGVLKVAEAIQNTKYKLIIAGNCSYEYLAKLKQIAGENIQYLGYLNKCGVEEIIDGSLIGVVPYLPTANCLHAIPNKMFEYMERGTPIIYSNFPDWIDMLGRYQVGIAVNPDNPKEILDAIDRFNMDDAYRMDTSKNARRAVEMVYNWDKEERKLLKVYDSIKKSLETSLDCNEKKRNRIYS